jgi:hypothetical protein
VSFSWSHVAVDYLFCVELNRDARPKNSSIRNEVLEYEVGASLDYLEQINATIGNTVRVSPFTSNKYAALQHANGANARVRNHVSPHSSSMRNKHNA